ncbi:MAG: ComEC family competence protein, partial [Akkermansia sp.]|nr:ComEC family competence protein [Akkermansia sp.]
MEKESHLLRPWPGRMMTSAPLLAPALAMLCACAAVDVSPWLWAFCACWVLLPCLFRMPAMSLLAVALAVWAGGCLLDYGRQYGSLAVEEGGRFAAEGSVDAISGRSVLFRPHGAKWLYTVSSLEKELPLEPGKRYRLEGEVYSLNPPCGPGLFDRERWGYLHRVVAGVRLERFSELGLGDWRSRFLAASLNLREEAAGLLKQGAPPDDEARQVMVSAVLGDKTTARPETMVSFMESGCMHVFAVSGMHVGLAAMLILGLLRLLLIRPPVARLACIPLLALYVFVTGMSVSALRALIMAVVWLLASVLRRKGHPANILALAFIVLCFVDPLQVFQPGFQLSFCVFAVIVCIVAYMNREKPLWRPDPFIPPRIYNARERGLVWLEKACRGTLLVSVGAWLMSIPLTAWHFGTWNLYAPFTNICLALLVPFLMGISLFGLMFAWCPWALSVCNAAAAWLAGSMLGVTQFAAALPCSYLPARLPAQENGAVVVPMQKNAWSVVISNPALVVDTGTENTVRYTLLPILKYLHIQPSGVMTTRNGKPERAGVEVLLQEYPGIQNWGRGAQHSAKEWVLRPGNRVSTADLPEPLPTGVHQDRSPVLAWTCRGRRVLLVGNAGFSTLARAEETERADVLIIGHHPRDPVSSAAWIRETGARTVIFTTEWGCPVPEGVAVYRLPETGALYLKAEEDGVTVT